MHSKSGNGFLRDEKGARTPCTYAISIREELEDRIRVNGPRVPAPGSNLSGGLVLSAVNLSGLDLTSRLTLILDDGNELWLDVGFAPDEAERARPLPAPTSRPRPR